MTNIPFEAIRKLTDYGMPLGATNSDWVKWRDEVTAWLDAQDWARMVDYMVAHAPEPEPPIGYPDDWPDDPDEDDEPDSPHYDTPGGF